MLNRYSTQCSIAENKPNFQILDRPKIHKVPKVHSSLSTLLHSKKPFNVKIVEVYEQSFSFQFFLGMRLYLQSVGNHYVSRQQVMDAIYRIKAYSENMENFKLKMSSQGVYFFCLIDPNSHQELAISIPYDTPQEAYEVMIKLIKLIKKAEIIE